MILCTIIYLSLNYLFPFPISRLISKISRLISTSNFWINFNVPLPILIWINFKKIMPMFLFQFWFGLISKRSCQCSSSNFHSFEEDHVTIPLPILINFKRIMLLFLDTLPILIDLINFRRIMLLFLYTLPILIDFMLLLLDTLPILIELISWGACYYSSSKFD